MRLTSARRRARISSGYAGLCLEVQDLALSKYAAGREKDLEFTRELARHRMTEKKTLLKRLAATRLDAALARAVRGKIERDFSTPGR
jgi:hypothetical protein